MVLLVIVCGWLLVFFCCLMLDGAAAACCYLLMFVHEGGELHLRFSCSCWWRGGMRGGIDNVLCLKIHYITLPAAVFHGDVSMVMDDIDSTPPVIFAFGFSYPAK